MAECNCRSVDVYVELSGKENYHKSLKGRDEANQHPIAAITNLQDTLDELDGKIDTTKEELSEDIESTQNLINNLDEKVTEDLAEMTSKIEELEEEISGSTEGLVERVDELEEDLDQLDTELNTRITTIQQQINTQITEFKTEVNTKLTNTIKYKGSVRLYSDLPTNPEKGDMYNVEERGNNYFWTGLCWDDFAGEHSLDNYATKDYVDGSIATLNEAIDSELESDYYNKTKIDTLLQETMNFRGMLAHKSDLDTITPKLGYFYKVIENNQSYIGTGTQWIEICGAAESYTKEQIDALLALKADKTELAGMLTKLNLGDTLLAGTGLEITKDTQNNTYTISVKEQELEPVIEEIVAEQINEVKEDVQANTEAIAVLDEQVKDLHWKKLNDVLSST